MIQIRNLSKTYGRTAALTDISLSVAPGTILGLAGENGCGRTTLLNILATLVKPTSGSLEIAGIDALKSPFEIRPRIGYISERHQAYDNITVGEFIEFTASCRNLKSVEMVSSELAKDLLARLNLERVIGSLSLGEKQRLAWIAALAHSPMLLLLDDPMNQMDPRACASCGEELHRFRSRGGTVLIACNRMEDFRELCDTIAVLHEGRLLKVIGTGEIIEWADLVAPRPGSNRHLGTSAQAGSDIHVVGGKRP